jgi:hypothetical protein
MPKKTKEGNEVRTFKLIMLKEKRDIIKSAIELCKNKEQFFDMSDSRALELICADFLSQYAKKDKKENIRPTKKGA